MKLKKLTLMPMRGFRAKKTEGLKANNIKNEKFSKSESPKQKKILPKPTQFRNQGFLFSSLKSGMYTVGFSLVVFGGCALWQQNNFRKYHENFWNQGLKKQPAKKANGMRSDFNQIWNHLSAVHKVTYGIIGANFLVFVGWKLLNPQLMTRWFTLSLANTSNQLSAMVLSMFSHKSFIHFYLNMYVLSSFCSAWNQLSKSHSQKSGVNSHERYLAFYLTAGMCSSLLSIMVKNIGRIPQPSLGASGAIMGLIGYTCEKMPNNLLSIVFLPNFTFTADSAKSFIIGFDTIGLLIGAFSNWRYMIFDHAGHLGGMLFGIWYAKYGEELIDKGSRWLMHRWSKK